MMAEVCGMRLHHGATAIRGSRRVASAPHSAGPSAPPPAADVGTWLRLTNASGSRGAAWYAHPLPVAKGFETSFRLLFLDPTGPDTAASFQAAGGLALVIHTDALGTGAIGCAGFGVGFRADPNPYAKCARRIRHGVAVAVLPDRVEVVRTETDFLQPLAAAYYAWPVRLDDGAAHSVRVTYYEQGGGLLTVYIDHNPLPLLQTPLDLQASALNGTLPEARRAADRAGSTASHGLVGFTAASGGGAAARLARDAAFALGPRGEMAATASAGVLSDGHEGQVAVELLEWQLATTEVAARVTAEQLRLMAQDQAAMPGQSAA